MSLIILKRYSVLLFIAIIMLGCGNKKAPTGGKKDVISPTILNISPEEFSDINNAELEVTFSKPINRNSVLTGIHIFPPVLKKKYKWDGNTLFIRILEDLEKDTNYFFMFNQSIKGEHGNKLEQNYIYVFKSGELNESRISGNFIYELDEDINLPVKLSLLSADSTFIYSQNFTTSAYSLDNLNRNAHVIRAYIDKNKNNSFDYEKEPYVQVITDSQDVITVDLELAYADTVKPKVSKARTIYNNLCHLQLSEQISEFESIRVMVDSTTINLPVIVSYQEDDRLELITAEMDTLDYRVIVFGMLDAKGNRQDSSSVVFKYSALQDSFPPEVVRTIPRNGSTVSNLSPEMTIWFSEIILDSAFTVTLTEVETGSQTKLIILKKNTRKYIIKPRRNLKNYSSYRLKIDYSDVNNIPALETYETLFIPIVRKK